MEHFTAESKIVVGTVAGFEKKSEWKRPEAEWQVLIATFISSKGCRKRWAVGFESGGFGGDISLEILRPLPLLFCFSYCCAADI